MSEHNGGYQILTITRHDEEDFPFYNFPIEPDTFLPPGYLEDGTPVYPAEPCWFIFKGQMVLGVPVWFPKPETYYVEK